MKGVDKKGAPNPAVGDEDDDAGTLCRHSEQDASVRQQAPQGGTFAARCSLGCSRRKAVAVEQPGDQQDGNTEQYEGWAAENVNFVPHITCAPNNHFSETKAEIAPKG